ncbi:hypothetical protein [Pseudodesulfovibrio piezophilus]|uniref:Uncharacterized protein n=1 Tax=Pseudodesulfovibrio piezophilus (strain DSM 21447 / JCM 15486 / C1TLV30) TaxID=1322246 RepID=M1WTU9_PSEP2|nr:hypothetical protein [Pseudodesulfovibrio piezophilus]CCH49912.1 conserved protein of unknown function [Pseudodesulfovibrio piezophilus C1TLV30]
MTLGAVLQKVIGSYLTCKLYDLTYDFRMRFRHFCMNWRQGGSSLKTDLPFKRIGSSNYHVFFGYYDFSPLNFVNDKCLALRVAGKNTPPTANEIAEVGYYNLGVGVSDFVKIGETRSWCWQQGCRLQWFPGLGGNEDDHVLYNTRQRGVGSVIQNIKTFEIVKKFSRPVYACDSRNHYAYSLDFGRLHRLRPGYGYASELELSRDEKCPHDNGIWRIDLRTGEEVLLFSIKELASISPLPGMEGADHYINHILVNPSGTRFLFIHLWTSHGEKFGRMFTADCNGENIHLVMNSGHASHYCWDGDDVLFCYSDLPQSGMHVHRFRDKSDSVDAVLVDLVKEDCHMSISPTHDLMLIDSYPTPERVQSVAICSMKPERRVDIAGFYTPSHFTGEVRCDLHPRWSRNGLKVSVDAVYKGKRSIYIFDVTGFIREQKFYGK